MHAGAPEGHENASHVEQDWAASGCRSRHRDTGQPWRSQVSPNGSPLAEAGQVYFSERFEVDPAVLEAYGALDISVVTDLPLFIDPFLLFNSEKSDYQALH